MGSAGTGGLARWTGSLIVGFLALLLLAATPTTALAAKPKVSASFGLTASKITVTGSVSKHAPRGAAWKAALQQELGKHWVNRASRTLQAKHGHSGSFRLRWKPPKSVSGGIFRVAILSHKLTVATSRPKKLSFGKGDPVPAPKVSKVNASQVLALPTKTTSVLVLSGSHHFVPGQFIAAAPGPRVPGGFLLKVTSSHVSKGKTKVKEKAASLYEAVPNGQISASLANLGAAVPQNRDARIFARAMRAASASASDSADVPFKEKVSCSTSAEMTLSGALHASLAPNFDLKWHTFFGAPTGIDRARATVDANLSAEAEASVSGTAGCKLAPITLLDPHWTVLVEVGPVPVPLTVDIPIRLEASASVSGAAHVKATASVAGSLGLEYHDGDIDGVHEFSSDAGLEHSVSASASAEAKIGPDITVEAGWHVPVLGELAAKVDTDVSSGLRLTYDPAQSRPGKLCVPLTVKGSIGLEIPVKGEIKAGPSTLLEKDIKCVEFGGTPEAQPQWTGTIQHNYRDIESATGRVVREVNDVITLNGGTDSDGNTPTLVSVSLAKYAIYCHATGEQLRQTLEGSGTTGGWTFAAPIQPDGTRRPVMALNSPNPTAADIPMTQRSYNCETGQEVGVETFPYAFELPISCARLSPADAGSWHREFTEEPLCRFEVGGEIYTQSLGYDLHASCPVGTELDRSGLCKE
jgi:hypothetical protein